MKKFIIYKNGSAKNPNSKIFEKYTRGSAPLRSLPPAHALENGFLFSTQGVGGSPIKIFSVWDINSLLKLRYFSED